LASDEERENGEIEAHASEDQGQKKIFLLRQKKGASFLLHSQKRSERLSLARGRTYTPQGIAVVGGRGGDRTAGKGEWEGHIPG